jgi:hypothetical protein
VVERNAPEVVVSSTDPAANRSVWDAGAQIAYRVVSVVGWNVPEITDPVGVVDQPESVYPEFVIPVAPGSDTPFTPVVYVAGAPVGDPLAPLVL